MHAEFEKLARDAASSNESYEQYLLRLTELEVTARAGNVIKARIKAADFPVAKDFDTFESRQCRLCPSQRSWSWLGANGWTNTTTVA